MVSFEENIKKAEQIAAAVDKLNGKTYYVGGFVRDFILGNDCKDVDIEIHGITPSQIEEILRTVGEPLSYGKSFETYGLRGFSLDIALPKEKTNGEDCTSPFLGEYESSRRRDFTINSIMKNVLTGEIIDYFNGRADLKKGIIRCVDSKTFVDDELRVFRAAQFSARFSFSVDADTAFLCSSLDLSALSCERVFAELKKALAKSLKPSNFFETLREMNQFDTWFPEVKNLIGIRQNPKYHPEGDVWNHTMAVLDNAVAYRDRAINPFGFMLSALTHDFGKAVCSEIINGEIHAYNHEVLGLPLIKKFLCRLTNENKIQNYVLNMSEHHMKPNQSAMYKSSVKATNKMFDKSVDPEGLICLSLADAKGSGINSDIHLNEKFLYERLQIYRETMSRPYVTGSDLIKAGISPNTDFSDYLAYAHKLRLAGLQKDTALKQTLSYIKQSRKK